MVVAHGLRAGGTGGDAGATALMQPFKSTEATG
jgi:hypothetical protein